MSFACLFNWLSRTCAALAPEPTCEDQLQSVLRRHQHVSRSGSVYYVVGWAEPPRHDCNNRKQNLRTQRLLRQRADLSIGADSASSPGGEIGAIGSIGLGRMLGRLEGRCSERTY